MENQGDVNIPSFGGPWTGQKLEILRRYLDAYTTALKCQPFQLTYVDAFAGTGSYTSAVDAYEEFYELRSGSTRIALDIDDKPFDKLTLIEKDVRRVRDLRELKKEYPGRDIRIVESDANWEIPSFCNNMSGLDRAVVFLDPYATQVSWATIEAIADAGKIDCWILFPLMAVTRMMPTENEPDETLANQLDRVFGGREHWRQSYTYSHQLSIWRDEPRRKRAPGSEQIASRYRDRLNTVFSSVAGTRRTLRNSKNAPLFELFFAATNPTGVDIADYILKHW